MAEISVATFDQIATILSKLATNYSNLFIDYETLFYSDTPADVTIQIYNAAGELETFTIPNRAKDRRYILNGNGSPEGVVSAGKGAIYQDLTNGSLYLKQIGTDSQGWYIILSEAQLSEKLRLGDSSPEGVETAALGTLYVDKANGALYIKTTSTGNTGWKLISASTSLLASIDLDNLSDEGETHFANPSLSNLSTVGQALIDSKENINNKVTTLSSSSTDTQYPSAKVVYNNLTSLDNKLANRDLSNLTTTGEEHFLGKPQIRDCILYAPNGLPSYSGSVISIPSGTILLGANGLNSDGTNNLVRRSLASSVSLSLGWTSATSGCVILIFNNAGSEVLVACKDSDFYISSSAPTATSTMYWYNPNTHVYKYTTNSGSSWTTFVGAIVARVATNSSGNIASFYSYHPLTVSTEDDIHRTEVTLQDSINTVSSGLGSRISTVEQSVSSVSARAYLKTSYVSGTSGYNIWSNGYCEQWGQVTTTGYGKSISVSFLKTFKNTSYQVLLSDNYHTTQGDHGSTCGWDAKNTTNMSIYSCFENYQPQVTWRACGYLASGQY